jgi:hypothetical protein
MRDVGASINATYGHVVSSHNFFRTRQVAFRAVVGAAGWRAIPSGLQDCSLFVLIRIAPPSPYGADMDKQLAQLQRNISRIRREIRVQNAEMQSLLAADVDCTNAARLLMRMQADLVLFLEKRERIMSGETA